MIIAVPPDAVIPLWPSISIGIERCLAKGIGLHSAEEVRDRAARGDWMLFLVQEQDRIEVVFVCSISEGDKRVFEIGMAWGKGFDNWSDEIDEAFTTIANESSCDSIAITGRRGWSKVLERFGYRQKMITLQKVLTNG